MTDEPGDPARRRGPAAAGAVDVRRARRRRGRRLDPARGGATTGAADGGAMFDPPLAAGAAGRGSAGPPPPTAPRRRPGWRPPEPGRPARDGGGHRRRPARRHRRPAPRRRDPEPTSPADAGAAGRGGARVYLIGGLLLVVGLVVLAFIVLGRLNAQRLVMVCSPDHVSAERGRSFPPWGTTALDGPEWAPIAIPPQAECQDRETKDRNDLVGWYLTALVHQASAKLAAKPVDRRRRRRAAAPPGAAAGARPRLPRPAGRGRAPARRRRLTGTASPRSRRRPRRSARPRPCSTRPRAGGRATSPSSAAWASTSRAVAPGA